MVLTMVHKDFTGIVQQHDFADKYTYVAIYIIM